MHEFDTRHPLSCCNLWCPFPLLRRTCGSRVTLSVQTASAHQSHYGMKQLRCADESANTRQWSHTSCTFAGHWMLDIWLSGNGMVLSEIWCPRKKSTNFGTFDLLSLICVRVQAYFSKLERTNLFWYAFEI